MADQDEEGEETEDENNQNKNDANKGAKKFFSLIIIAVVMLFVIGGVTVAYFTGLLDPIIEWTSGAESEENEETSLSGDKEQEEQFKILIDMDSLAIPVFQGNKIAATVQMNIKLVTDDEDKAERIKKVLPIIADAFISDLHGFLPRLLKAKKKVDYVIIKQRLELIANKVLGKGVISNIIAKSINDQSE